MHTRHSQTCGQGCLEASFGLMVRPTRNNQEREGRTPWLCREIFRCCALLSETLDKNGNRFCGEGCSVYVCHRSTLDMILIDRAGRRRGGTVEQTYVRGSRGETQNRGWGAYRGERSGATDLLPVFATGQHSWRYVPHSRDVSMPGRGMIFQGNKLSSCVFKFTGGEHTRAQFSFANNSRK